MRSGAQESRRPGRSVAAALLALVLSGTPAGLAEEPPLSFSGRSSVAWVLVPVTARGPAGRVENLRLEDFELSVDGHAVPVASFDAGPDAPIRLIYLQDLSGSMANAGKLEASRRALRCFLERTRPGDEYALMTFASGETWLDVPFSRDMAPIEEALEAWEGYGTTALHDAVARLPEVRADDRAVKRAAVLVTDGGDNASTLEPERARDIVRTAELPVYVIDLKTHRPPPGPGEADTFAHLLRLLAGATGGRYLAVVDDEGSGGGGFGDGVEEACAAIVEELRFQYVLGFETAEAGDPAYHEIGVEVAAKRRLQLSHRRGYVGLEPRDASSSDP